jgi:hypothetical protein
MGASGRGEGAWWIGSGSDRGGRSNGDNNGGGGCSGDSSSDDGDDNAAEVEVEVEVEHACFVRRWTKSPARGAAVGGERGRRRSAPLVSSSDSDDDI